MNTMDTKFLCCSLRYCFGNKDPVFSGETEYYNHGRSLKWFDEIF